jgi:hypothetical protein
MREAFLSQELTPNTKAETSEGSASAVSGPQSTANSTELEKLRVEIDGLKQKLPSLPRGVTTAGAICGLIAVVFSLVGGLWSAYQYLSRSPKLSLVQGPILGFAYLPNNNKTTFTVTFSVANDGDLPNIVTDMSASVANRVAESQQIVFFDSADFDCASGQAKVSLPFTVGPGLPNSITCTAIAYVPESGRPILADGSAKRFSFLMMGQKGTRDTVFLLLRLAGRRDQSDS